MLLLENESIEKEEPFHACAEKLIHHENRKCFLGDVKRRNEYSGSLGGCYVSGGRL